MKIEIANEYEFNFENTTQEVFHISLLQKNELYKKFIDKIEDYERTYTEFNMIDLYQFHFDEENNQFEVIVKIYDLLAYNKSPFYYKKIIVRS